MKSAQVEALDFARPNRLATEASRLLLSEIDDGSLRFVLSETGDGALRLVTWKPDVTDVEAFAADIDPENETFYGVVERPAGYLAAAAQVIHGATACLSYERPVGDRMDEPYTAVVGYAVQPNRMESGYDRLLFSHIAREALTAGDSWVTLSIVGPQTVASLEPLGFMGSTELLGARSSDIVANCPAPEQAA